jgi:hypothetical protein
MQYLTNCYADIAPIVRILRENWIITVTVRGSVIKKPINEATTRELHAFVRTFGPRLKLKTVARCRQRLAADDLKLSDADRLILEALRCFFGLLNEAGE